MPWGVDQIFKVSEYEMWVQNMIIKDLFTWNRAAITSKSMT